MSVTGETPVVSACPDHDPEDGEGQMFFWSDYVDMISFPVVFLCCLMGSVLIIVITRRRVRWDNAGEWYLTHAIICSLAVSDMLGTISESGIYIHQIMHFYVSPTLPPLVYLYVRSLAMYGRGFCLFLSNGLLICFSIERAISLRPSKQRLHLIHLDSVQGRAVMVLCFLIIYSTLPPLPYLLDDMAYYSATKTHETYPVAWISDWMKFQHYHDLCFLFGTCLTLTVFSAIVFALIKNRETGREKWAKFGVRIHRSVGERKPSVGSGTSSCAAANRTLFGCVLLYFFTQMPVMIRNLVIFLADEPYCLLTISREARVNSENIVVMLARLNFACNFLIYVVVDQRFRRHAKMMFLECLRVTEKRHVREKQKLLFQLSSTRNCSRRPIVSADPVIADIATSSARSPDSFKVEMGKTKTTL